MSRNKSRAERPDEEARQMAAEDQGQNATESHPVTRPIKTTVYREELAKLQVEMFRIQERVQADGSRLVVLFEGPGPAGKRATITSIAEGLHRKVVRVTEPGLPTGRERGQWPFQRFVEEFPTAGKITLFDGSWYHDAIRERAQGQTGDQDFRDYLRSCADFEQTLVHSGITLIKYWFAASPDQQEQRFRAHIAVFDKHRKAGEAAAKTDASARIAEIQEAVFTCTGKPATPWYLVRADDKRRARLNCMRHLLNLVTGEPAQPMEPAPSAPEDGEAGSPGVHPVPEVY